ncbi:MAG: hypothetical protein E7Z80_07500 [Methanobrevibacter thaueri]|jgi:hypothetical protein|nr:hypothetical protein [Methanobrevibacter thaueri]
MGLKGFDNIWYCDKCDIHFKDEDDYIYCPNCGDVLKNDWYQMALQSIEKYLNETSQSVCEDCCEEFDISYNFCPLCSNKLKKESIMGEIRKDNSITAYWNGEEICVFDKNDFLDSPHFSGTIVIDCFKWKNRLDYKLESDFLKIDEKPPQKLSFAETYSIFNKRGSGIIVRDILEFLPKYTEDNSDHKKPAFDHINILKIRDDLYVKIVVDYIEY